MRRVSVFVVACVSLTALLGAPAMAEGPDMRTAEKLLRETSWKKRIKGLDMLAELGAGDRAERLTIKTFGDTDWAVQIRAAAVAAKVGKDAARKALIKQCVHGEVQDVRDAALEALRTLDTARAATRLIELARKERDPLHQERALDAAAGLIAPEHIKKVRPLTRDKNVRVQAAAVRALGTLAKHDELRVEIFKTLKKLLAKRKEKKFFHGYIAAIESLGALDLDDTRTLLLEELMQQPDEDPYVPERIARALGRMKGDSVAAALTKTLERAKTPASLRALARLAARLEARGAAKALMGHLGHKDQRVRSEIVRALGLIGDEESAVAIEPLLVPKVKEKNSLVPIEVVTALARLRDHAALVKLGEKVAELKDFNPRLQYVVELAATQGKDDAKIEAAIRALAPFTTDEHWRVSTAAIVTIGTLGIAKDLPVIQQFATHKHWQVRAAAFEAFGRLRAIESVPLLIEGLADKDPVVKGVCHANLQILLRKKYTAHRDVWHEWWNGAKKGVTLIKLSRRTKEEVAQDEETKKRNERYAKPAGITRDEGVKILQNARILVVSGAWDKVEVVLDHLLIKHTLMRAQELKHAGLNPNQVVLINCEGNIDKDTRKRLRWFVNVGGYVMTTDWALTKAVRVSFPGYIEQFAKSSTGNDVVVVEEASPGHTLTRGVFEDVPALKWWLEVQAFPITITYPERCDVLVDSAEMRQRYGSSPMAAVFRWGLGKVQHSLSHFYLQEEGMQHVNKPRARMIFSRDNLGLSFEQIRDLVKRRAFTGSLTESAMREIAPDYSMFRLIVNMVAEKALWVESL